MTYSRKNPFLAPITEKWQLTKPGSNKETLHFIINLADSEITYAPGDSLGVFALNPPELVDEVINLLGFDPNTPVTDRAGEESPFRELLLRKFILNRAGRKILATLTERLPQGEQHQRLSDLLANDQAVHDYIFSADYVDILKEFSEARFESAQEFLNCLYPIAPRLYSIASSLQAHPGEVHLCVGVVRYTTHGRARKGLCSGFLADHVTLNSQSVPVYIQQGHKFRLPADHSKDIIMCGPGTGIAPFRAFLEQRVLDGATGRNWLIFGEQHRSTDFFYEHEFLALQEKGNLHRLDVAFSRDQAHKIYVQDRIRENAREFWEWMQNGAYFYVCGDAKRMAKDVHEELVAIGQSHGGLSEEAARHYVDRTLIRTEKRYLRDVY